MKKCPFILDCARVIEYAIIDKSIIYKERDTFFVGGKILGKVPKLAICQNINEIEYLIFYCDRNWNVLGAAGYKSINEAKAGIERSYPGLRKKWVKTGVTKKKARTILKKMFKNMECSFCNAPFI